MRLRTCVALELLVGASLATGLGVSVTWGLGQARAQWQREAQAAQTSLLAPAERAPAAAEPDPVLLQAPRAARVPEPELSPEPRQPGEPGDEPALPVDQEVSAAVPGARAEPVPEVPSEPAPRSSGSYHGLFNGVRDDLLLAPLYDGEIKEVRFNRGGSSISLRIDFADGSRAAFKPEQSALQTIPRKEVAAYRIDRLLGLGAVPPAIGRALPASKLIAAVESGSQMFVPRLQEEMTVKNDRVAGELSWWIPVIKKARVGSYEIDTTDGIVTWKRYLEVATKDVPREEVSLMAQISSMVLFDFLINNPDRWSGANARVSEDERILYFMDNTMSFGPDPDGHRKCRIYLKRAQKFSRSLVAALRALTADSVHEVVSVDKGPFEYLLSDLEIEMLMKRRDYALAYIDELISEHGESAVLVFP